MGNFSSTVKLGTAILVVNLLEVPLKIAVVSVVTWLYTRFLDGDLQGIGPLVLSVVRLPGLNSYKSLRRKKQLRRALADQVQETENTDEAQAEFWTPKPDRDVHQYRRVALEVFALVSLATTLLLANLSSGLALTARQKNVTEKVSQASYFTKRVDGNARLFTSDGMTQEKEYHVRGARSFNFYISDRASKAEVALEAIVMCNELQLQRSPDGQIVLPELCMAEVLSFDIQENETMRAKIEKMTSPFLAKKRWSHNQPSTHSPIGETFRISTREDTTVLWSMAQMLKNPLFSPSDENLRSLTSLLWNKEEKCGRNKFIVARSGGGKVNASMELRVWFTVDPFRNVQLGAQGLLIGTRKCGQSLNNTNVTTNANVSFSRDYVQSFVYSVYLYTVGIITVLLLVVMVVLSTIRSRRGTGDPAELLGALSRQIAEVPSGNTSVGVVKLRESWTFNDGSADVQFRAELYRTGTTVQVDDKVNTLGESDAE